MIERSDAVALAFLQTPKSLFHGASINGALKPSPEAVRGILDAVVEAALKRARGDGSGVTFVGHKWRSGGGCFIVTDGRDRLAVYFTPTTKEA